MMATRYDSSPTPKRPDDPLDLLRQHTGRPSRLDSHTGHSKGRSLWASGFPSSSSSSSSCRTHRSSRRRSSGSRPRVTRSTATTRGTNPNSWSGSYSGSGTSTRRYSTRTHPGGQVRVGDPQDRFHHVVGVGEEVRVEAPGHRGTDGVGDKWYSRVVGR